MKNLILTLSLLLTASYAQAVPVCDVTKKLPQGGRSLPVQLPTPAEQPNGGYNDSIAKVLTSQVQIDQQMYIVDLVYRKNGTVTVDLWGYKVSKNEDLFKGVQHVSNFRSVGAWDGNAFVILPGLNVSFGCFDKDIYTP